MLWDAFCKKKRKASYFLSREFVIVVAFDAHSHHSRFVNDLLDNLAIFAYNLSYKIRFVPELCIYSTFAFKS